MTAVYLYIHLSVRQWRAQTPRAGNLGAIGYVWYVIYTRHRRRSSGVSESIQSTGNGAGTGLVLILHRVKCWA
jgi:hypothetical protein